MPHHAPTFMRIHAAASCLLLFLPSFVFAQERVETLTTAFTAAELMANGPSWNCLLSGDAVSLNDLCLIENDAPGAGKSEKGAFAEPLHSGVLVKKTISLDDMRTNGAWVVLYMTPQNAARPAPYYLLVNGHRAEGKPVPWQEPMWHWVPIPAELLAAGENEIVVGCDAPEGQGFDLLFAREDEYARGGGAFTYQGNSALIAAGLVHPPTDPLAPGYARIEVGKTSGKSTDGGQTWQQALLGPGNDSRGEYTIRLSLDRYVADGALVTEPVDLWAGAGGCTGVLPACKIGRVRVDADGEAPESTNIVWSARSCDTPAPDENAWSPYTPLGEGAALDVEAPVGGRFVQVRADLTSGNPLETPRIQHLRITREVSYTPPAARVHVQAVDNPAIQTSAYWRHFQDQSHPKLRAIRQRLGLDALLESAHGDFEKINRVRHHVSQLWLHQLPYPEYPEWDALSVLDRKDKYGRGGMCMQFVVVFSQALQSLGYQTRHVNLFNHESCEVWVDELGRWVLVDPESIFDSYEFNTETGAPLSALEQHEHFLKRYGFSAERPIDWMGPEPWCNWPVKAVPEIPQPLDISTATDWINHPDPFLRPPQHNLAGFMRIIPRNDFLDRPDPRPLNNGSIFWPWNGFLCWYDAATPRKRQYMLHSNRAADFYPTLNRVHIEATYTEEPGVVDVRLTTQTPGFEAYEVRVDGGNWESLPADHYRWALHPSALNRLEVRVRKSLGILGKPSSLEVLWHYQAPYQSQTADGLP